MSSDNNLFGIENDFDKLGNKYDKNKLNISFNRVAFIFFVFILVLLLFSLKAFYLSGKKLPEKNIIGSQKEIRSNIIDRNNNILAKTILTRNIGINPNLVIDKKTLILKLKILFPDKNYDLIEKKLNGNKFFYFAINYITKFKLQESLLNTLKFIPVPSLCILCGNQGVMHLGSFERRDRTTKSQLRLLLQLCVFNIHT